MAKNYQVLKCFRMDEHLIKVENVIKVIKMIKT